MNKIKGFFKKAVDKICFCLFAVFFYLTYPLYIQAKKELDALPDEDERSEKYSGQDMNIHR